MAPKAAKKKGRKSHDKKAVRVKSVAQFDAEYDGDEFDQEWGEDGDGVEQLNLSSEELDKDITIILRADNPYFSEEFIEYSFKDLEFKTLANFSDTVTFFSQAGDVIHKSMISTVEEKFEEDDSIDEVSKRKNKFNYCDRAVQTTNLSLRHQIVQTDALAEAKMNFNATLWAMTSSYEDYEKKVPEETRLKHALEDKKFRQFAKNQGYGKTGQFLVRMVNQSVYSDVTLDFGYYDNPCDEFLEEGMGSILPLWKFTYKPMRGVTVTAIAWNYRYPDLFAAAYGTTEFIHEEKGCICLFTLKNTACPEKVFDVNSPVQCMDFSKVSPHLLAAGLAHGQVLVFDIRCSNTEPFLTSLCCSQQHTDYVCQVKWLCPNIEELDNFCSISSDGKVINWRIAKSELLPHEIVCLKNEDFVSMGPENSLLNLINGGTSVSFNHDSSDVFIVGSEQGVIYKCSDLYSQLYLTRYEEHTNTVYCVEYNPFHPRVFLSCSADWTIKIWDHSCQKSVFMFDMFYEVEAAAWAPFSSTLFAAITKDGKVHVFDLMMNRQLPTCTQTIHSQMKHIPLTSVSFNPKFPILMVGDARGSIISYKLSPNLRSSIKGLTELEPSKFIAGEIDKMEKVLQLAKSPDSKEKGDKP